MARLSTQAPGHLALAGPLTIYEVAQVAEVLREQVAQARIEVADTWTLDLAAIDDIDTSGLQLLLSLRRQLQCHGARLLLREPSPVVSEILRLLRLDAALPVAATAARFEA
ncbi:MAG: hypothetical protein GAK45_00016 [Pseudomonas citronellolis]|nr:MAG: hypothetical protein GAK45_00016 [Pseudomonas citronellolis]